MPTYTAFYQQIVEFVTHTCPNLKRWRRDRLVFFIFGILISGKIVFSRIAHSQNAVLANSTLSASHERRLRRIGNDPYLNWENAYAPALKALISEASKAGKLVVILDETWQEERYCVLAAALWYRGRAIPLAWQFRLPTEKVFWQNCEAVLHQVAEVLPKEGKVVVVADRAFGCAAFTDLVEAQGWDWLVRLPRQTRFSDGHTKAQNVRAWLGEAGRKKAGGQLFKKRGWRKGSLVGLWDKRHKEPLLLGSSLPPTWSVLRLYKYRYAIESLFRDWKSAGFDWEKSGVRQREHCAKVLLGLNLAVLITLLLGEKAAQAELERLPSPKRHSRPYFAKYSLFYLGRHRMQSYLVGKVQTKLEWRFCHFEAERWSKQIHQHHTKPFVFCSNSSDFTNVA